MAIYKNDLDDEMGLQRTEKLEIYYLQEGLTFHCENQLKVVFLILSTNKSLMA